MRLAFADYHNGGGSPESGLLRPPRVRAVLAGVVALSLAACRSEPLDSSAVDEGGLGGTSWPVTVPRQGEALVDLATSVVASSAGKERPATGWDLGFRGLSVFTNGGVSGSGAGAAFGVLPRPTFLSDTAPAVPFWTSDQAGGAFRRWYAYDGENHTIMSRYHVYGVRAADRLFKVQVLSYYGGRSGESSAQYSLRFAELAGAASQIRELREIDASAGGDAANPELESSCIDLGSGALLALKPAEALARTDWHLCLRRDAISVNGGAGGPGGVTAVDLSAADTDSESLAALREVSAEDALARFVAVGESHVSSATGDFRADSVVTAFSERWLVPSASPPEPASGVWLVRGADGTSHYLVIFEKFSGASEVSPGTVTLRVKAVL